MSHWCICGLRDAEHDPECYASTEADPHTHLMPLCCPHCPCLSYEDAHPELFGTLVAGRVDARTKTRLAKWAVYTMERLESDYPRLCRTPGFGPVSRRDMWQAIFHWRIEVERGTSVRRPLPESAEFDAVLEAQKWPYRDRAA